jgi:DNA-binding MarR family transcriptional regulator
MVRAKGRQDSIDRFLENQVLDLYPTLDPEVEGAVERLWKIVKHLDRTTERTVAKFGLNGGEFHVLQKLRCSPTQTMTAGELAERLSLSSGAMTNRLDGLEEAGLITRVRDPEDRRSVIAGLTDAGIDVVGRAVQTQGVEEERFMDTLTQAEGRKLNDLLRKLVLEIEDGKEGLGRLRP